MRVGGMGGLPAPHPLERAAITERKIRRGTFRSTDEYLSVHNENPTEDAVFSRSCMHERGKLETLRAAPGRTGRTVGHLRYYA